MSNKYYELVALRRIVGQRIAQRAAEGITASQRLARAAAHLDREIARLEEAA
jgi:hypothetical protein